MAKRESPIPPGGDAVVAPAEHNPPHPVFTQRARTAVLLLAVLTVVVSFAAVVSAPQAVTVSATPASPLRFLAYNICGGYASCTPQIKVDDLHGESAHRSGEVVRQAREWNTDVILLNEVCAHQYLDIERMLRGEGYVGLYAKTTNSSSGCRNSRHPGATGTEEGLALFARGLEPVPAAGSAYDLGSPDGPDPDDEVYKLLCGDTRLQGRQARACVTHWAANAPMRARAQAAQARIHVDRWLDEGIPVVVGGDLNQYPFSVGLNNFYGFNNGNGRFIEVDETDRDHYRNGQNTADSCVPKNPGKVPAEDWANCVPCEPDAARCRSGASTYDVLKNVDIKPDYIFLSERDFTNAVGETVPTDPTVSDHEILRGSAHWRLPAGNS